MKEDEAMELLWKRYGLLKAARLLNYASALQALGPQRFDAESSKQQRSKMIGEMREAGVYWDDIEWQTGVVKWWVKVARKHVRRTA